MSNLVCHLFGFSDVSVLRGFVASAKQYDDRVAAPDEIDAISRPIVDPKLTDAVEELGVPYQAGLNAYDPLSNLSGSPDIWEIS
ncbi:hypothetical protein ABID25_002232 [Mesorhizobium abyssinicae]